jgi:tol-pal system protein YbgF
MNSRILLILAMVFAVSSANADSQTYGLIIQKQSKQIEDLTSRVSELEKALQEMNVQLKKNNMEGVAIKKPAEDVAPIVVKTDGVKAVDDQKIKSEYDIALATLKDGEFEIAEKKFAEFIENYPSSKLQSNATFWYSESFYRREIFDKAAINYLKSYKKYPKGDKASDALFKLADSLAHLDKGQEACSMLAKLESEFPNRSVDSMHRAREISDKLHCK